MRTPDIDTNSKVKLITDSMEKPKNWDFKVKFPNGMITYYYSLDKEYSKDDIVVYASRTYHIYIDNYLYLKEYQDVKSIDMQMFSKFKKGISDEQREVVVKKYISFNKNSDMIKE